MFDMIEFLSKATSEPEGTRRLVALAYFISIFIRDIVWRSLSIMAYSIGSIPDPWTILVFILAGNEILPLHLTN